MIKWKKLNKEEMLVGFIYGSSTWPLLSWRAFIPGLICALLWAIGGSGPKGARRVAVPFVVAVSLSFTSLWLLLTMLPLWGVCTIGYGMPDATDEGSALGRFWLEKCRLSYKAANWATRFSIFILFVTIMIASLAILKI